MNYAAIARLAVYVAAAIGGLVAIIWGTIHNEPSTIATGIGLLVSGGLAAPNTPIRPSSAEHGAGS